MHITTDTVSILWNKDRRPKLRIAVGTPVVPSSHELWAPLRTVVMKVGSTALSAWGNSEDDEIPR